MLIAMIFFVATEQPLSGKKKFLHPAAMCSSCNKNNRVFKSVNDVINRQSCVMIVVFAEVTFREILNNNLTYDDQDLIAALKAKDDEAYIFLYDSYSAALYSIIKQMASDTGTANDVLQEVLSAAGRRSNTTIPQKKNYLYG